MAVLSSAADLRAAFPQGLPAGDLAAAVTRAGHSLSPELAKEYADALAAVRARYPAAKRQQWAAQGALASRSVRTIDPPTRKILLRVPGDYDVIAAVDLATVDQILAGLLATRTVPNRVDVGSILSAGELGNFVTQVLRVVFAGIPDGPTVSAGGLVIGPGLHTAPVPGTNQLRLHIPFSLEIIASSSSPTGRITRTVLTQIRGSADINIAADAKITVSPTPGQSHLSVTTSLPPNPSQPLQIAVAPDSPVQPRTGQVLDSFTTVLGLILNRFLGPLLPGLQISPFIDLPEFDQTHLLIRQIDLRTQPGANGGAIVVGSRIGGLDPDPGDPTRLTNPLNVPGANLYLRVHEQLLQNVLDDSIRTGQLDQLAKDQSGYDDLHVESATAHIADNTITVEMHGKLQNACAHVLDAPFVATVTVNFSFEGDNIVIKYDTSVGPDWSSGYTYLCIIASLAEGVLAFFLGYLAFGWIAGVLSGFLDYFFAQQIGNIIGHAIWNKLTSLFSSADGSGPKEVVVPLDFPVPGTELLPRIQVASLSAQNGAQEDWYGLTFAPDNINYHVYAAFLRQDPFPSRNVRPLSGGALQLMDQDAPAPAGDDVKVPDVGEQTHATPKAITTVTVSYQAPTVDENLGGATTTIEGIAHFTVAPDKWHNNGGFRVVTTSIEWIDGPGTRGGTSPPTVVKTPIVEQGPDLYFLLSHGAGTPPIDTRRIAPGLLLNADNAARRIGSPASPITFTIVTQLVEHA